MARNLKLCSYRSEYGAKRYAEDCAKLRPEMTFRVVNHPYDFRWTVAAYSHGMDGLKFVGYVASRRSCGLRIA